MGRLGGGGLKYKTVVRGRMKSSGVGRRHGFVGGETNSKGGVLRGPFKVGGGERR